MGFHTKAEYTLALIKQPRAHELIAQRFVAYGFILSASTDERTLKTLIDNWQEIDRITAGRIRYLFFIENEVTLTGWPNPPSFTRSGYEREHCDMLNLARKRDFSWRVDRQGQMYYKPNGELNGTWRPQHKVVQLAQQLGVEHLMPCLAWIVGGEHGCMHVKSLQNLDSSAIVSEIKQFCDGFYNQNFSAFTGLDEIECLIRKICGPLDITLKELDQLDALASKKAALRNCIVKLQNLNPEPTRRASLASTLSAVAQELVPLKPSPISLSFSRGLKEIPRWVETLEKVEQCLKGADDLNIGQLASEYEYCIRFENSFPENTVKFRPSAFRPKTATLHTFSAYLTDKLLAGVEQNGQAALATRLGKIRYYLKQNIDSLDTWEADLRTQVVTHINVLMLLRELSKIFKRSRNYKALGLDLQADLLRHFHDATHCIAIELHLWMYGEISTCFDSLDARIRKVFSASNVVREQALQSKSVVQSLVARADALCENIATPPLHGYKKLPLPRLGDSPVQELLSTGSDHIGIAESLAIKLSQRFTPIAEAINSDRAPISPYHEMVEQVGTMAGLQILAAPGSLVQFAQSIVNTGGFSMTTQNTNIIDSEIKDSQVVVAKSITDSFNRVQESSASDEIKSKLAELTKVVDVVRKHLPAEVAQDMAKDLDTFVVEATKKVPRRKWYDLSAEGLKQAAQTVGEIGKPILGLIKGV